MVRLNNATVVIVNVGKSSGRTMDGKLTELDASKRAVREFVQYHALNRAKDEIAIVLYGSDETSNVLNKEDDESYIGIKVLGNVGGLDRASPDVIKDMDNVSPGSSDKSGDVIEALVLAAHLFEERKKKGKKFRHRVVIITNGESECVFTNKDLESYISNGILNLCVRVDVVGIGSRFESDDLFRASKDLEKEFRGNDDMKGEDEEDDEKNRTALCAPMVMFLSKLSKGISTKARTVADVVAGCEAPICGTTTVFRGDLQIGPKITIGVYAFNKTTALSVPTLKKESTRAEPEDGEDISTKGPKFAKVTMDREHRSSETQQEVPPEKRRNGYRYGADICVEDLTDKIIFETSKELELIGFVENKQIPRHHYMSKSIALCAEPGNDRAAAMLSSLNEALRACCCKAIVRFVKRNNTQPFLGCLDCGPSYLVFNQLPFAEDVRDYMFGKFEGDERFTPSNDQEKAVDALIDALPMSDDDVPMKQTHPVISRFYRCLHARYLDPKAEIVSEPDFVESAAIEPNRALLKTKKCSNALKLLKEEFKIRKREPDPQRGDRKRRRVNFWGDRDTSSKTSKEDSSSNNNNKTTQELSLKLAGDSIKNSASFMDDLDIFGDSKVKVPSNVGTINPVSDFRAITSNARERKDVETLKRASEELTRQAMNIYSQGSEVFIEKVISCIKELCVEATRFKESVMCNHLNTFLRDVSSSDSKLWNMLVQRGLHHLVGVSETEAASFLSSTTSRSEQNSSTKEEDKMDEDEEEEEDLFDSMN